MLYLYQNRLIGTALPSSDKEFSGASDEKKKYEKKEFIFYDEETGEIIEKPKEKRPKKTTYKVNKQKIRDKLSVFAELKQSKKFLAFYSVSFPMHMSDDHIQQVLNTCLTRLRQKQGLKSYLWRAERQQKNPENNTLHYHIITNNYMNVRIVNYMFARAIENVTGVQQIFKNHVNPKTGKIERLYVKYNGCDVRQVYNTKQLKAYITKYVTKDCEDWKILPWHCSRDISRLNTSAVVSWIHYDALLNIINKASKNVKRVDMEYCTVFMWYESVKTQYYAAMLANNQEKYNGLLN